MLTFTSEEGTFTRNGVGDVVQAVFDNLRKTHLVKSKIRGYDFHVCPINSWSQQPVRFIAVYTKQALRTMFIFLHTEYYLTDFSGFSLPERYQTSCLLYSSCRRVPRTAYE